MLETTEHLDKIGRAVRERQRWLAVLARAPADALVALLRAAPPLPPHERLRGPEIGLAMVRGRQGGDGAAFNLGEVPLTRCAVRLADGTVGHAYAIGRAPEHAECAAVVDAALQDPARRPALLAAVIAPLAARQAARAAATAARAATTRVDFQTLGGMR